MATVVKVSNNPHEKHITEGGCYVGNFHNWTIKADGVRQSTYDVCYADAKNNEIAYYERDDNGFVKVDGNKPVLRIQNDQQVFISGYIDSCTSCDKTTQRERQRQPWWALQ